MIAYIKGNIIRKTSLSLIIQNEGLGYEVYVPLTSFHRYQTGDEVEVVTYLHVREDVMQLYGFQNWEERDLFLLLINVSGIGPKGALTILSNINIEQFKLAIVTEDFGVLTKLPGIGKKTAQRLVLELKDKISVADVNSPEIIGEGAYEGTTLDKEISEVLISLGYQPMEVKKIIPRILQENPNLDEGAVIKKALQILAKV